MANGGTNGSHPPGNKFTVECIGKIGATVNFAGETASLDATFTKQEDADYFVIGTKYVVDFTRAHSGDSGSGEQS